jgi:WD40 repeat protein
MYTFGRFKRKSFILLGQIVHDGLLENIKYLKLFKSTLQAIRYKLEPETSFKVEDCVDLLVKLDWDTIACCDRWIGTFICIWSIKKKEKLKTLVWREKALIEKLIKINSTTIVSTDTLCVIAVWNYKEGTCLYTMEPKRKRHFDHVIKFSKTQIITTTGTIKLWDLEKRTYTLEIHELKVVYSILRIDASHIASASDVTKYSIEIWDMEKGKRTQKLDGHQWVVSQMAKLDGNMIASGDNKCIFKVWDLAEGKCIFDITYGQYLVIDLLNWSKFDILIFNSKGGFCICDFKRKVSTQVDVIDREKDGSNSIAGCIKWNKYQLLTWNGKGKISIEDVLLN